MSSNEMTDRIARYCAEKQEIAACYLFGSHAAGTNRQGSDLDIAILLSDDISPAAYHELSFELITAVGRTTRLDVHPLIMNNAGDLVLDQVFRKGICLYGSDTEALRSFRRRRLPMIAEFSYYVAMMQSKLKQRHGGQDHG